MRVTTIDRYIVRELFSPLIFGIGAFTCIFVAGDVLFQLARLLVDKAISYGVALLLFVLQLPRILVLTFPMSVLLASILCFGRLSDGHEVVAMRAGGVGWRRIAMPAVILGLVVALFSLGFGEFVVPPANQAASDIMWEATHHEIAQSEENLVLKTFKDGKLTRLLYAAKLDGATGELTDVVVQYFNDGKLINVTSAARAKWNRDSWEFIDGVSYTVVDRTKVLAASFARQTSSITESPQVIASRQKSPQDMSIRELVECLRVAPPEGSETRRLWIQFYLRLAVPFASLIFALVGAPLGMRSGRASVSLGFGMSLIIIFAYYVIISIGSALGERGGIPPFLGAWAGNFIIGGIGLWMFARDRR